jgi:phage-related minor tail protein
VATTGQSSTQSAVEATAMSGQEVDRRHRAPNQGSSAPTRCIGALVDQVCRDDQPDTG